MPARLAQRGRPGARRWLDFDLPSLPGAAIRALSRLADRVHRAGRPRRHRGRSAGPPADDRALTIACKTGVPDDSPTFAHLAVRSALDRHEIVDPGTAENSVTRIRHRGPFDCVEARLENRLLLEVLASVMQRDNERAMTMQRWRTTFALGRRGAMQPPTFPVGDAARTRFDYLALLRLRSPLRSRIETHLRSSASGPPRP